MQDIRVAAVIFHSPLGNIRQNLERMTPWIEAAKREQADIICFPEMNISGYGITSDIENAATIFPNDISEHLIRLADRLDIHILAGMAEKDETGRLFASHLEIRPGGLTGVYRKLHIAPPEIGIYSKGKDIPIFDIKGTSFGIQLCYDAHFPELSTCMALNGADIIFIPHASPRGTPQEKFESWMRHLPARAYDNSVFVIACNQVGENGKGLLFPGVAVAIDPAGRVIDKSLGNQENMLIVDLKSETLNRIRNHRMRYFLPHRRPELYPTMQFKD